MELVQFCLLFMILWKSKENNALRNKPANNFGSDSKLADRNQFCPGLSLAHPPSKVKLAAQCSRSRLGASLRLRFLHLPPDVKRPRRHRNPFSSAFSVPPKCLPSNRNWRLRMGLIEENRLPMFTMCNLGPQKTRGRSRHAPRCLSFPMLQFHFVLWTPFLTICFRKSIFGHLLSLFLWQPHILETSSFLSRWWTAAIECVGRMLKRRRWLWKSSPPPIPSKSRRHFSQ